MPLCLIPTAIVVAASLMIVVIVRYNVRYIYNLASLQTVLIIQTAPPVSLSPGPLAKLLAALSLARCWTGGLSLFVHQIPLSLSISSRSVFGFAHPHVFIDHHTRYGPITCVFVVVACFFTLLRRFFTVSFGTLSIARGSDAQLSMCLSLRRHTLQIAHSTTA